MSDASKIETIRKLAVELPADQLQSITTQIQQDELAVFGMLKSGDVLGIYCAVRDAPELLTRQDESGMTLLHWASIDPSGTVFDVLTDTPNSAPQILDKAGRLPLDVAGGQANDQRLANLAVKLERVTYPNLFRDELEGPVEQEKLAQFESHSSQHTKGNTAPGWLSTEQISELANEKAHTLHDDLEK